MSQSSSITVAHGDGIGPEIMDATLHIIQEAGAKLDIETIDIGEKVYLAGNSAGIAPEAWDSLNRTKVFLKAPITTPQGGGYKSLNVTIRKSFGLFANVRPCVSYYPYVATKHPQMDVVIIRENEEDLYAGVEHQQTPDVVQCLKLITRQGTERIVRYAFEYAKSQGRKKVTCFTKDNIMKMSDGMFHKIFEEIGKEYPELEKEHWIVDIGAAKLADTPEMFDVVVLPNLYGDILSDVAAQIAGSVGLAGSANIGENYAMFEAIHGSAPRRAGQNLANPSGLLLGGIQMLQHLGQYDAAERAHNAWLKTLEEGIHTYDIFKEGTSKEKVGTKEFAQAVVARLGQKPEELSSVDYKNAKPMPKISLSEGLTTRKSEPKRELCGVDVFICDKRMPEEVADQILTASNGDALKLQMISNRGMRVWPNRHSETLVTEHQRCRFVSDAPIGHQEVVALLGKLESSGIEFIKMENLYQFDGEEAFSKGQGQ